MSSVAKRVLIVGGAGYIGAHTCMALSDAGYEPVVFDNLSTGHREFVQWGPLLVGDIRDESALASAFKSVQPSAVIHFAAHAYVGESVIDPQKYYETNVLGSLLLLKCMRQAGCSRIVFSSTCSVYGEAESVPIRESQTPRPINPYGFSKLVVERALADYNRAYGLGYVALRYFNAAGADTQQRLGEKRDPETHLIPRALMSLQGHIKDFKVFGTDFPTPDGTAVRDYIHVLDLAAAHLRALSYLDEGGGSDVFNVGTGHGYSVKEVLNSIEEITGYRIEPEAGGRRAGDPAILVADAGRAMSLLKWQPQHSDIDTIVRTAWRWHQTAHPKNTV